MIRMNTPTSITEAPAQSQALLSTVKASLGSVPNLFRMVANSPAALEGYMSLHGALAKGALDAATGERIALAIAQFNECDYCLAAHSLLAKRVAKLPAVEIAANRRGGSTDARADAAVRFALEIAINRGQVAETSVEAVREAGYSDAQIVEIIANVALNTLTNYMNTVLGTELDFPAADKLPA